MWGDIMLPMSARPGDIVEVTVTNSRYFGMLGKLVTSPKEFDPFVKVNFHGKEVKIPKNHLTLKARTGSATHSKLSSQIEKMTRMNLTDDLTCEDYDDLINLALDLKDYEWAKELVERKYSHKKKVEL